MYLENLRPAKASCDAPGLPRLPVFHGDYSFNTGQTMKPLGYLDYAIVIGTLLASACICLYQAWRSRWFTNIEEFTLAGRSMNPLPVSLSLFASFVSAIGMSGIPAEFYVHNTLYLWHAIIFLITVALTAHVYVPVLYKLRVSSTFEYLERRFSRRVRVSAAIFFVMHMVTYSGIALYIPSVSLNAVTGFDIRTSIISICIVCTGYTAVGGLRGVIYTDVFQAFMIFLGLILLLVKGILVVGSAGSVWDVAVRTNRIKVFEFRHDPTIRHTVWSLLLGGVTVWLGNFGANQLQMLRTLACPTLRKAKIMLWLTFIVLLSLVPLCCAIGLYMSAFYENCDPQKAGLVDHSKITLLFAMDILGNTPGLAGLFLAALLSGSLSTISSAINAVSVVVLEDLLRPFSRLNIGIKRAKIVTQLACVILGVICLELAYLFSEVQDVLQVTNTIIGSLSAPVVGVFLLGLFFPFVNEKGALSGLFTSFFFNIVVNTLRQLASTPPSETELATTCVSNCNLTAFSNASRETLTKTRTILPATNINNASIFVRMSYLYVHPLSVLICVTIGVLVSMITGFVPPKSVDPRLVVHLCDTCFPCFLLPERVLEMFRYNGKRGCMDSVPLTESTSLDKDSTPKPVDTSFAQASQDTHGTEV